MNQLKAFTDLKAWQEALLLAKQVYGLTKLFPKGELFGLTRQMRRCSVSVSSNIAEGFNRFSKKEKIQFYSIALGSISELESQLILAQKLGFTGENLHINKQLQLTRKLLQGLIRSTRS
jgi:four helix bundle protein